MRVLCVSAHLPINLQIDVQGMYKRMRLFLDAIAPLAQLEILFFVPPEMEVSPDKIAEYEQGFAQLWQLPVKLFVCPQSVPTVSKLQQQIAGIFDFFQQGGIYATSQTPQIEAFERCLDRQPDVVVAHGLQAMGPILRTQRSHPPVYFDLDNIEHILFMRQIRQPPTRLRTLLYFLQVPALMNGERQAMQLANCTFVCSDHDRQYLQQKWGLQTIATVPNAIEIPPVQPITSEPTLLLLGAYHYFPNINAANFLIEQVWPKVLAQVPQAKLIVAGKEPQNIRAYQTGVPNVEFTGFVENLTELYARSRIVCGPIFSGGGTRVKLLEAAAYGKPIVATRIGVEGLNFRDGQEFLLRNTAESFAAACIELLQNDLLCQRLGAAARETATHHYDRAQIIQQIQTILPLSRPSSSLASVV